MLKNNFEISVFNEHSILIQFDFEINEKNVDLLLFYRNLIIENSNKSILQVINTYNSLLVIYAFTINKIYNEKENLKELILSIEANQEINSRVFEIPVCYDEEYGLDLQLISEQNNIEISQISELHSARQYRVFFIGFLPGFPYLSYVDQRLEIKRKKRPRSSIPKGSVGIAGLQTGIYPEFSPAGWQIIGKTPLDLFDKINKKSLLSAGDYVRIKPVSKSGFLEIQDQVFKESYQIQIS
ncbi:MAG: 5-oxoprolinase subunit PxpB [Psychroflexus halocasei]